MSTSSTVHNIIIDDGFKTLLVPLKPDELQLLEEQLVEQGVREPLIVWPQVGGPSILIDGHNRHAICTRRGIKFDVRHVPFESRQEAERWIVRNQLGRRNLNEYERSLLALRLKPTIAAEAEQRMLKGKADPAQKSAEGIETREVLAEIANVSRDTIAKVEVIEAKAIPEVREAVRTGKLSINKAAKAARAPTEEQTKALTDALADIRKARRRKPRRPAKPKQPTPDNGEVKVIGVGVARANEAINCLTRIPKNDALRRRGFQIVTDWIRHNEELPLAEAEVEYYRIEVPEYDKLTKWVEELVKYVRQPEHRRSITGLHEIAARGREILNTARPGGAK